MAIQYLQMLLKWLCIACNSDINGNGYLSPYNVIQIVIYCCVCDVNGYLLPTNLIWLFICHEMRFKGPLIACKCDLNAYSLPATVICESIYCLQMWCKRPFIAYKSDINAYLFTWNMFLNGHLLPENVTNSYLLPVNVI